MDGSGKIAKRGAKQISLKKGCPVCKIIKVRMAAGNTEDAVR
jgi:hypothetical protein